MQCKKKEITTSNNYIIHIPTMTIIEERFFNAAIQFFNKKKTKKDKRYEIAKSVLPHFVGMNGPQNAAEFAVEYADALLAELDKKDKAEDENKENK